MSIAERFERRVKTIERNIAGVRELIKIGRMGGEEDRLWMDSFCKGVGLDICCGDLVSEGAIGVDISPDSLGMNVVSNGSKLLFAQDNEFDYIVCNYFDCFESPVATLNEWKRILKPGGVAAFLCADADKFSATDSPLSNRNRVSLFNTKIIMAYLHRCGYTDVVVSESGKYLRVAAHKQRNSDNGKV